MAIYYARKAGNVNATDVWATTPSGTASNLFSSFTSADTLYANGFSVTLNVNTTVLDVRTDNTNSATAGGAFTLSDGVTLTANVVAGSNNGCVGYSGNGLNSATIVGSVTGGTGTSASGAVLMSGTGTLNIVGNVTAGSTSQSSGVQFQSGNGTINITGNVTGGGSGNAYGVFVNLGTAQTLNITGIVTGGSAGVGVLANVAYTLNLTGTAVGGVVSAGISVTGSATVTATRAKGNGFGNGSSGLSAAVGISVTVQTSNTRVYEVEYGDRGQSPTSGPIILLNDTSNVVLFYRTSGGKKTLIDSSASAGHPSITNVRSGIAYANNNLTGTCAVPAASSVTVGVAVDNTTGTAVLTQADVETALASFSSGRLSNCATVATVGQQLSDALSG
jgi:hypothetical protein